MSSDPISHVELLQLTKMLIERDYEYLSDSNGKFFRMKDRTLESVRLAEMILKEINKIL